LAIVFHSFHSAVNGKASGLKMPAMRYRLRTLLILLAIGPPMLAGDLTRASAAEWGSLKMRFVYDGEPPQPTPIVISKDRDFCGKNELVDESLLVHREDRGIANVVICLVANEGIAPPVHPSFAARAGQEVAIDIQNCRFQPHVTLLRTSQTLRITNRDPIGHNTNIHAFDNAASSTLIPTGPSFTRTFSRAERNPVHIDCSIHPWLSAWLIVSEHPYLTVSDEHGTILMDKLPVGKWQFRVWHERCGWVQEVLRHNKAEEWRKGYVQIEVGDGEQDLGDLKLSPPAFKR
jgi:plastocyanin